MRIRKEEKGRLFSSKGPVDRKSHGGESIRCFVVCATVLSFSSVLVLLGLFSPYSFLLSLLSPFPSGTTNPQPSTHNTAPSRPLTHIPYTRQDDARKPTSAKGHRGNTISCAHAHVRSCFVTLATHAGKNKQQEQEALIIVNRSANSVTSNISNTRSPYSYSLVFCIS